MMVLEESRETAERSPVRLDSAIPKRHSQLGKYDSADSTHCVI